MKLQADQARLQDLLKQTITLLCKNGLQFKKNFQVKALIGVSTDEENTFVVDINETFGELDDEDNEESLNVSQKAIRRRQLKRASTDNEGDVMSKRKRNAAENDSDDQAFAFSDLPKQEGWEIVKQKVEDADDFDTEKYADPTAIVCEDVYSVEPEPKGKAVLNRTHPSEISELTEVKREGNKFHYPCYICNKVFFWRQSVGRHMATVHNYVPAWMRRRRNQKCERRRDVTKVKHFCNICKRGFTNKRNMEMHRITWHNPNSQFNEGEGDGGSVLNYIEKSE